MRLTLDQWTKVSEVFLIGVTFIGGGAFTLTEYWHAVKRGRVQETLNFVQQFNQGPVGKARTGLDNFWYSNREEARKHACSKEAYSRYVIKKVIEEKLDNDVRALNNFFELLLACIDSDLCDEASAFSLLGTPAAFLIRKTINGRQ